ncbi:restriction endonuclease [Proteus mirabilis]|uniref:restriction endonuclease n=1 Tax=Proteus TaxID=583 RepID=UPI001378CB2B|nr:MULTISPECIES: restriction endonuclease [Proteus]EKT8250231.1 restriction endonuclease [Proteus mirabilis]EKU6772083.1 restriction endonuclease [Proteus mirabilis]EKV7960521.1 restriction endonuclease [Proteus mirabilis]EKY0303511.1 restriction endonuclease [Proteus mirabilis]EKY1270136.1 restriction endonuclease [Proteus mirabilis]
MIDDPLPENWQDLQTGVQRIFRNVGLLAEVEVDLETPRGSVNVDVLATDVRSVDKIRYIVECKNWGSSIPQTVVHSFTTVMHETGANIGFIISKHGLQRGAKQYTQNTNIIGMTYLEFQQRYFEAWWYRYFCPRIGDAADEPLQYVEPINSKRDREYAKLSLQAQEKFDQLRREKGASVMVLSMFNYKFMSKALNTGNLLEVPKNLDDFKTRVLSQICPHIELYCDTYRELLKIILEYLSDTKAEFDTIFGGAIFEPPISITGVTADGPPLEDGSYHH